LAAERGHVKIVEWLLAREDIEVNFKPEVIIKPVRKSENA
jgi:hypothetical protein